MLPPVSAKISRIRLLSRRFLQIDSHRNRRDSWKGSRLPKREKSENVKSFGILGTFARKHSPLSIKIKRPWRQNTPTLPPKPFPCSIIYSRLHTIVSSNVSTSSPTLSDLVDPKQFSFRIICARTTFRIRRSSNARRSKSFHSYPLKPTPRNSRRSELLLKVLFITAEEFKGAPPPLTTNRIANRATAVAVFSLWYDSRLKAQQSARSSVLVQNPSVLHLPFTFAPECTKPLITSLYRTKFPLLQLLVDSTDREFFCTAIEDALHLNTHGEVPATTALVLFEQGYPIVNSFSAVSGEKQRLKVNFSRQCTLFRDIPVKMKTLV